MVRAKKKRRGARLWQELRAQLPLPAAFLALWALAQLEPWLYLGALTAELGFQLVLAALGTLAWALAKRRYLAAAGVATAELLLASPLLPFYRSTKPTPTNGPQLRVVSAHMNGAQLTSEGLSAWLEREQPDALALTGLRSGLGQAAFGSYLVAHGSSSTGAHLLIQRALTVPPIAPLRGHASSAIRAGRCQARLVALELPAIVRYGELDAREHAIEAARSVPNAPRSVWLGQLGSRAEAHDLKPFFAAHQLRDARIGHGRFATAPPVLGPLGWPMSGVLVHGWIGVREMELLPPLAEGGQRAMRAVLELTEPRCRSARDERSK